jgi:hypothetical protein
LAPFIGALSLAFLYSVPTKSFGMKIFSWCHSLGGSRVSILLPFLCRWSFSKGNLSLGGRSTNLYWHAVSLVFSLRDFLSPINDSSTCCYFWCFLWEIFSPSTIHQHAAVTFGVFFGRSLGPTMNEKAIWEPSQCAATQLECEEVILHLLFSKPTHFDFVPFSPCKGSLISILPFFGP